jgi:Carbohydrate binding domain/Cellulase (glycosyl hydrolase family 5)
MENMMKNVIRLLLIALLLVILSASFLMPQSRPAHAATISPLHVSGNQLIDASGTPVILRGVNRSGTEYACAQGWGIFDGPSDAASISAIASLGSNSVNIGLNEDCWLGINGVNPAYSGANYQNAIVAFTQLLEQAGIYPIISYMWGAPGTQLALDQPSMPDADHATALWTSVANTFKNDNRVLLRLQEEPHPAGGDNSTAAWNCWANGGSSCNEGYSTVGFKSLMRTVRATGATNVVQVPGVSYANDMTQFLTNMPVDSNQMGVVDVYGNNVCGSPACFDSEYAPVAAQMPFMAGEFGETYDDSVCGTTAMDAIMGWFDAHHAGYDAWVWDTWGTSCGNLSLILSYDGTLKSPNGVDYKNHLLSLVGQPTPTPTATNTPTPTPTPASFNLLVNGSFDSGSLSPWALHVTSPAAGSAAISTSTFVNGTASAKVKVSKANSNARYVQFSQRGISMVAGHTYTLTFYIKASVSRKANVVVQKSSSPWTTYMGHTFSVSTVWAEKTVTFTPTVSDIVGVNFNLAQHTGAVYIDAVSLR